MTMVQVSDFHVDLWYTPGSNSICGEPLCCRSTSLGHNTSAGPWGELNGSCDTPTNSGLNAITQMARNHHDVDFIVWTGDTVAHDVWNVTREVNLKSIKTISDRFKKEFPSTIILPALGNHEAVPVNL